VTKLAEGVVLMDEISSRVFHSSRNKKPGFHYAYSVLLLPVSSAPVFVAVVIAFFFVFFAGKRAQDFGSARQLWTSAIEFFGRSIRFS
jgi:hypothetical protein